MSRILVPSAGPQNWRQFLAQPEKQWVTGFSARTVAHAWEAADAAMIVHSFSPERRGFDAYERFCHALGCQAEVGVPAVITMPGGKRLVLG